MTCFINSLGGPITPVQSFFQFIILVSLTDQALCCIGILIILSSSGSISSLIHPIPCKPRLAILWHHSTGFLKELPVAGLAFMTSSRSSEHNGK